MSPRCPSPERVPECHSYFPKRRACFDVAMIVCPTTDDRVEQPDHILLFSSANRVTYLFQEGVHVLLGRRNQELAAVLTQVVPQEVEALFDMRDAGFLR